MNVRIIEQTPSVYIDIYLKPFALYKNIVDALFTLYQGHNP